MNHECFIVMMEVQAVPILLRYGGAEKSIFEMNDEELEKAAISILRRAREKAFSKGLPIIPARMERSMLNILMVILWK